MEAQERGIEVLPPCSQNQSHKLMDLMFGFWTWLRRDSTPEFPGSVLIMGAGSQWQQTMPTMPTWDHPPKGDTNPKPLTPTQRFLNMLSTNRSSQGGFTIISLLQLIQSLTRKALEHMQYMCSMVNLQCGFVWTFVWRQFDSLWSVSHAKSAVQL